MTKLKNTTHRPKIAVDAEEIVSAIEQAVEQERRAKIAENNQNQYTKDESATEELIPQSQNRDIKKDEQARTRTKIAETFNTPLLKKNHRAGVCR
jgi:hypothetical protein